MTYPSNSDDYIDSRDVIKAIEELESECDDLYPDGWDDDTEESDDDSAGALPELRDLLALQDEADGSPDWQHGETLIRDSYFEDYAQQLAEDIGAIGTDLPWPACHIDWEAAASALQIDYMSVDFDGVEYWIRA